MSTQPTYNEFIIEPLHSRAAEEAYLGCLIIDASQYAEAPIDPDDMYVIRHRWILQAIIDLGVKSDIITLTNLLEERDQLEEAGGAAYLTTLFSSMPFGAQLPKYAGVIRAKSERRGMIEIANEIAKRAYQPGDVDVSDLTTRLAQNVKVQGSGAQPLREDAEEYLNWMYARAADPREVWGIPTGFPDLDKITGGWHPGRAVVIVGDSGLGKTQFILQSGFHAAKSGFGVHLYELEMSTHDLIHRLVLAEASFGGTLPWGALERGTASAGVLGAAGEFVTDTLMKLPLYVSDETHWTPTSIRADILRNMRTRKIDLVIVDYAKLVQAPNAANEYEAQEIVSRDLRNIAKDLNVAMLTVNSQTKDGSIRGSNEVKYTADEIWRLELEPALTTDGTNGATGQDILNLLPVKRRHGGMGLGKNVIVSLTRRMDSPKLLTPTIRTLDVSHV